MTTTIQNAGLTFLCDDPIEVWRAQTVAEKEPGTLRWLEQLHPGDVFVDIGANIGVYTLVAAQRGATVYAFEPHLLNALHLQRNVAANGFNDRVVVVPMALYSESGATRFAYRSLDPGSSGHQCGTPGDRVACEASTLKLSLDAILTAGLLPRLACPALIKIDVDGAELEILIGARDVLRSPVLRSIQVEMDPRNDAKIVSLLAAEGFVLTARHYTAQGERAITKGTDPRSIVHNGVFDRRER